MNAKRLSVMLAFVAVLALGIVIGYALRPSVDVRVSDPGDLKPAPPMVDPDLRGCASVHRRRIGHATQRSSSSGLQGR